MSNYKIKNKMSLIKIRTEDEKNMELDERILNFSELFKTLHENYETKLDKPLTGIKENDVKLLIKFCDACDYIPINIETPLWKKTFQANYNDIIGNNAKLERFYNELTDDNLLKYFKICYFYNSNPLRDFLFFKLYDVFNDKEKFKNYFKDEGMDKLEEIVKINDEKKNYLYKEYQGFIEKQVNSFSDEEIENYLLQIYP